jgi:alpha-N-arabinofuranosidase
MKPAFVRFPGGCYVEGDILKDRFDWRRALGNQEMRRGHYNLWGYYSEDGLGMFEYLSFVEKLTDAYGNPTRVVWVVNNGIAHTDSIPTPDIAGWVQDALDSIEFAQGATTTKFGALRAQMGHPQPFKIDHMAIGNEDCGKPYYDTNYKVFYDAITNAYPDIITIANCQNPGKGLPVQSWDYHVYKSPQWFFENQDTFDKFDHSASAARIFNSEYAVTDGSGKRGNLIAALGEAAWMNGLERNSDLVTLASYAPLFVNDNDRKWSPDAIVFNSSQVFGTPSYWNQVLYSNSFSGVSSGTAKTLAYKLDTSTCSNCSLSVAVAIGSLNSVESQRLAANTVIIHKVVNYGATPLTVTISLSGLPSNATISNTLDVTYLTSKSPNDENDFQNPTLVSLQTTSLTISKPTFEATFPAYSVFVVRAYATL